MLITAISIHSGKLALTSLFVEGETDYLNLKSMCDLCPELQKLHLLETSIRDVGETKNTENALPLPEIASDFKKLNKVLMQFVFLSILVFINSVSSISYGF